MEKELQTSVEARQLKRYTPTDNAASKGTCDLRRRVNPLWVGGASILLGTALFVTADLYGSSTRPGYSPVADAISELVETGAPNKSVLDFLIGSYHAMVVPFAYGLYCATRNGPRSLIGPALLAVAGALGVGLTMFFPCDRGCEPLTARGTAHIFIAIPMGLSVIVAILVFSRRFSELPHWAVFATYSKLTALVGLILACLTITFAESDMVGLLERVLTLSYLQWYVVVGTVLLRKGHPRR